MADIDITKLSEDELRQLQVALTPKMTKYIPITPTPKQTAALLMNNCRELLYGGAAGGGKALDVNTPLLTVRSGWKTMGTARVGDQVFGRDGVPTTIVAKSEVFLEHDCFKLTFDDGAEIIADADHLWQIDQCLSKPVNSILTTRQLYDDMLTAKRTMYAIRKRGPLVYAEEELLCHPYAFGVWLGDGSKAHGNLACQDEEIHSNLKQLGYDVYTTPGSVGTEWKSSKLRRELRSLGFCIQGAPPKEKSIPEEYLRASGPQRLQLLWGLMDTDGNASSDRGYCSICMVNKPLMLQIEELVRSLGIKATLRESVATCGQTGTQTPKYNLKWSTPMRMFTLPYKDYLQAKGPFRGTQTMHYIKTVEKVPSRPTQCITVDNADHVYLAGRELIPTHNSVLLLAAALQYVDTTGYSAIIFRKTFSDLMLPGALIPMSHAWLSPFLKSGEVRWQDKEKRYTFLESGATVSFGYLDAKNDELRYQGAEFQFVGMDEVTHIDPAAYRYLFSRLRRLKGSNIPIRMRSSANPGGPHGEYYYQRFFVDKKGVFLPAGLSDNPHLDADEYRESLAELDPVTRKQLEDGDWEIRPKGDLFDKSWILEIDYRDLPEGRKTVRFWDLASIDPKYRKKNSNKAAPDWTIGFKLSSFQGCYYIEDISKLQKSPGDVEAHIAATAEADGAACAIRMEEEGGASGIANTERYSKKVLVGYNFAGIKPVVSKIERARPVAAACQVGNVFISNRCRNITDFFTQLEGFPNGANDDIVDSFSGAFAFFKPKRSGVFSPPTHRERIDKTGTNQLLTTGSSYWHNPMNNR